MKSLSNFNKDRYGGALLVALSVGVLLYGSTYRTGTLMRAGPGFLPVVVGGLLLIVGIAIFLTADRGESPIELPEAQAARLEWRGPLCILGGVFAFVVLSQYGGLVPASAASVFIAAVGDRDNTVRGAALLASAASAFAVVVFHYGLHLQLPMFNWG